MVCPRGEESRKDVPLYDPFSADYDRFVNWEGRLAYELPFIEQQLTASGARRILDTACGTGMHAIALAQRRYDVTGADLSVGMIERARENAAAAGVKARFVVAGFGELAAMLALNRGEKVEDGFDAVLCLGNSLPHVLTADVLHETLTDFAAVLRPGGLLFIQNRNFDAVMEGEAARARWMPPQAHREGGREWLFIRFYDFNPDGTLAFNILTLRRDEGDEWTQQVEATTLRPLLHADLLDAVAAAGFGNTACHGDMTGAAFDPETSGNLIVAAQRE
jgi:glycine/sarcosine N-methyltransferase